MFSVRRSLHRRVKDAKAFYAAYGGRILRLCNDEAVLGPWRNGRAANPFAGAVIAAPIILSVILTASVVFPDWTGETTILAILIGGGVLAFVAAAFSGAFRKAANAPGGCGRETWRMPALGRLARYAMSRSSKAWMAAPRLYLLLAAGLAPARIVALAVWG